MPTLICHTTTPSSSPLLLFSEAAYLANGEMQLHYVLQGDLDKIYIPAQGSSTQQDNLWQQTCFEAFISVADEPHYYEYNFSPSRQWAIYTFEDYRQQVPYMPQDKPIIQVHQTDNQLAMSVRLPHIILPENTSKKTLKLGLTAVIEDNNHDKSYWALQHPFENPDFHSREGFGLKVMLSK
jgi:hypothetical protein